VVATTSHPRVHLKVGDRVAGWVHGGMYPDRGSYAEYLHIPADLCWKVPDNVTPQQAGAYGVPYCTAFHGLVHSQKGAWPPTKLNKWVSKMKTKEKKAGGRGGWGGGHFWFVATPQTGPFGDATAPRKTVGTGVAGSATPCSCTVAACRNV
jgi:hypothetical protein